jgi:hypothetical protein
MSFFGSTLAPFDLRQGDGKGLGARRVKEERQKGRSRLRGGNAS